MFKYFNSSRRAPAAAAVFALLASLAPSVAAQDATAAPQSPTQTPQTQPQQATPPAQTEAPARVLGAEVEAKPDGSMYRMKPYPQAGYWVAYSRTAGDAPMVMITMQKTP